MGVIYEIDLSMTNKVANNFLNDIASYVENNCLLPAEKVYTELSLDWSGFAAKKYLLKIYKLIENYSLLNNCLIAIGKEISKIVQEVAKADRDAGGELQTFYMPNLIHTEVNIKKTSSTDTNILSVTDVTKKQMETLADTIDKLKVVISKIQVEKENLERTWKTGSGREKIISWIEQTLENISVFEQSALMLFSSLNQATSILLEESVDSSTSVTSTSSGAQRTKKCPYCSFIMPISETICPNCNKGI